jgi:hypothetical protein
MLQCGLFRSNFALAIALVPEFSVSVQLRRLYFIRLAEP